MTTYAKIRTGVLVLDPQAPDDAPDGSVYLDSENSNALTTKTTSGSHVQVGASSSDDIMIKTMENLSGFDLAKGDPVAKKPDGSIVLADADGLNAQIVVGTCAEAILNGTQGRVALVGPNVANALLGRGFQPGQEAYLTATGTYTANPGTLDPTDDDSVVRMGVADCPAGAASTPATDLIMFSEVVARPT